MREFEVEKSRFRLFELTGDGQNVMREPGRFGHGHIDHHHQLERRERLPHAVAVGQGMHRIATFDDEGAKTFRVIGEDLFGDDVAGHQSTDDARPGDRRAPRVGFGAGAAEQRHHRRRAVGRALFAEIAGEQDEQFVQVGHQRGMAVHLHAEVFEAGHAAGRGQAAGGIPDLIFGYPTFVAGRGHIERGKMRQHLVQTLGVGGQPILRQQVFLHQHRDHRAQ